MFEAFLDPTIDPALVLGADRAPRFRESGAGLAALGLIVLSTLSAWFLLRKRLREHDRPKVVVRDFAPPAVSLAWLGKLDAMIFSRPFAAIAGLFGLMVVAARRRA